MENSQTNFVYDYIVIGSGPAGAVMAKTLTDDGITSVLLLEAGENHDLDGPIKDSSRAFELEESFAWKYYWQGEGVPQEELGGRTFEWTTGRLSGGGSSINGEQYVRPSSAVLNDWKRMVGALWSPEQAINRFKELEMYFGKTNNPIARGFHGQMHIRQAPVSPSNMAKKLVAAIEQATGFDQILDYNDPETPIGPFTRWQLYQKPNGSRESASTAFLLTPEDHDEEVRNLTVFYQSTALRVLFMDKTAVGVEFLRQGEMVKAYARKKVILSAGIHSAQLLMLSGIGPAKLLEDAGIPVVIENENVGGNLRNHTLNFAVFTTNPKDNPSTNPDASIGILHSDPNDPHEPTPDPNDPNALYTGGAFLPNPTPGANQNRREVQLIGMNSAGKLNLIIIFLNPKSSGSIQIQNKDPLKIALADEGFLKDPSDLQEIKNIYKTYIKSIAEKLADIDGAYRLISPTEDIINDDAKLEKFIKEDFGHNHHHQGALRMAPLTEGGVVDHLGQVHGVENLIIADASIAPFVVDGNTSATAYLIGYTIAQQLVNQKDFEG